MSADSPVSLTDGPGPLKLPRSATVQELRASIGCTEAMAYGFLRVCTAFGLCRVEKCPSPSKGRPINRYRFDEGLANFLEHRDELCRDLEDFYDEFYGNGTLRFALRAQVHLQRLEKPSEDAQDVNDGEGGEGEES